MLLNLDIPNYFLSHLRDVCLARSSGSAGDIQLSYPWQYCPPDSTGQSLKLPGSSFFPCFRIEGLSQNSTPRRGLKYQRYSNIWFPAKAL